MKTSRLFSKTSVTSAILGCASLMSVHGQSVTNGLKVYLNFDNSLNAQGPTTINGSVFAGTTRYINGKFGKAVSFLNNGSSSTLPSDWAVSLGNLENIYSNSFSVSFWVRTTSTTDAAVVGNKNWVSGVNLGWVVKSHGCKLSLLTGYRRFALCHRAFRDIRVVASRA